MYSADDDLQTGLMNNANTKKTYGTAFPFIKKQQNIDLLGTTEEPTAEYQMLPSDTQPSPNTSSQITWNFTNNSKESTINQNIPIQKPAPVQQQQVPRKEEPNNGAMAAHMKLVKMNHERNEMEGCLCFFCGNKVLIPSEATLFKCFFCQRVCDRTRPPVIQKKYLMCGVCRTVIQYTPISNYVRCVCGTVNQIPKNVPQPGPGGPPQYQ